MGYYSMVVRTNEEVAMPDQRLVLFPGVNLFTTTLTDEEAPAFMEWLAQQGCVVEEVNRLDGSEETPESLPAPV